MVRADRNRDDDSFRRFLRRVWSDDVAPLLRDRRAAQRRKSARTGGKLGAGAGLVLDSLFGLKGKPFARFGTVVGSSFGAMLPDVWDWKWLQAAEPADRKVVEEQVVRRVAEMPEADALSLFDLSPTASRDEFKVAWREIAQRWHPDKAPNDAARSEFHVRFLAYSAAHKRLVAAYDAGRLPQNDDD